MFKAEDAMDRVTSSSVAGKTLATMTDVHRKEVRDEFVTSLQKDVNKSIKKSVLGVRRLHTFSLYACCSCLIFFFIRFNSKKSAKMR